MDYTSITTKDDQILDIDTAFRILTTRVDNVIQHSLIFKDYINECNIIKNNCKMGKGKVCIFVIVNYESINKIDTIVDAIVKLFNNTNLYNSFTKDFTFKITATARTADSFFIGKLRNVLNQITVSSSSFKVYLRLISESAPIIPKKEKLPEILRPGILNESFLELLVLDQLQQIKEIEKELSPIFPNAFKNSKLILNLYEQSTKKVKIGPIRSIQTVGNVRIGGLQQKPDILINVPGKSIKISIKANIFPGWSSASNYVGAKSVFDYFQSKGIIEYDTNGILKVNNITCNGIAIPATLGEVKKFCFNGDEVDYILINNFSVNDIISNLTKVHNNNYTIDLRCNRIYINNNQDIQKIQKDVYLTIQKSTSKSSKLLPGFRIEFVPKNKLRDARLLKTLTTIPGRL